MKHINEVGLELIQLEDRVLLVDNLVDISNSFWVLWKNEVYSNNIHSIVGVKYDECKRIITSTKPYGGLPLLVIADDAEKFAFDDVVKTAPNSYLKDVYKGFFKRGYNKAKDEYKFTEDDLVRAFNVGTNASFEGHSKNLSKDELMDFYSKKLHNLNQSLIKKELFIEVEYDFEEHPELVGNPKEEWYSPKISEGKIKGVWN